MKKFGKIIGIILIVLVALALVLGAGVLAYFKLYLPNQVAEQSFPQVDGQLTVAGLEAQVDIYRDQMGIPHIYASTQHDLFFAQGFVHAQDRFWQMDFWRHLGSGRLSEMFGAGQVETDSFLRTLGWRQTAEQEYQQLSPNAKSIVDAYSEGVNAYLKDHTGTALSLEYAILKLLSPSYEIEAWTPVHSLTWGKAMAWSLGGNLDAEIERAMLLKTLTPEQLAELYPPYPADYPVIVPVIGENVGSATSQSAPLAGLDFASANLDLAPLSARLAALDAVLGPRSSAIGSNSWVVSGQLTSTGKPLLANDMHLAIQMPAIWYENSLHCQPVSQACPFDVIGFSFVGVPGVVAGHNSRLAWGFTNLGPDVQDLFIEKVNPDNPNQYEVDGQWVDFETRTETINVAGGDPLTLTVRLTRHGPVVSDTYGALSDEVSGEAPAESWFQEISKDSTSTYAGATSQAAQGFSQQTGIELPEDYVVALAWTALTPETPFEALWGFDIAQNWEEFREAARHWSVPAQNIVYADVDGNIAYQTPGNIPIRKAGDGSLPVPGWNSEYDWTGFIPFEELPYVLNPQSGYIATANNQASPRDYPYLITSEWDHGQRAARIVDLLANAPGKIDIAYIQQMHGDAKSLNAEVLVPILLTVELDSELAATRDQYLSTWDYQGRPDSVATTLFNAFWWGLLANTFNDDLPPAFWPGGGSRWIEVMRNLVQQPDNPWWDDKNTTDQVETRDDIFAASFAEAVNCQMCIEQFGKDLSQWKWGQIHTATFFNETLGTSGIGLIEDLFNRGPYATGGGESIVNATSWGVGYSFEVLWLPSEREIVDLGNLDNSLAIYTTGQSGHAYHPHYDDMAPLWADVQYAPMWWEQASVINDSQGHLILTP